jgi:ribosomal protein S18 acetylase RimI-like enzyme
MSTDVSVRDFESADLDRIAEITKAAWEPVYESYRENMGDELFDAKYGDWREYKVSQVKRDCRRDPASVRIACLDDDVAGYATFSVDKDAGIGEIGNNAVDPACQGRGVATTLYDDLLEEFEDRDLKFAEVSTGLTDPFAPARRTYEKVGFDIERPAVTYWQEL